jgi:crotonobetainyl-CoA:carnitine CoA-transferase CaiB-like acyl-CoA transferase
MAGTLQRLFEALDLPDALSDPRFATHEARLHHVQALDELLQSRFQTRDLDELMDLFDACDVTAGPILTIADLMQHPQVTSRELLVDVDSPQGVRIPVHGVPHQVNGVRPPIRASAPKLGEHNARWGIPALDDSATP